MASNIPAIYDALRNSLNSHCVNPVSAATGDWEKMLAYNNAMESVFRDMGIVDSTTFQPDYLVYGQDDEDDLSDGIMQRTDEDGTRIESEDYDHSLFHCAFACHGRTTRFDDATTDPPTTKNIDTIMMVRHLDFSGKQVAAEDFDGDYQVAMCWCYNLDAASSHAINTFEALKDRLAFADGLSATSECKSQCTVFKSALASSLCNDDICPLVYAPPGGRTYFEGADFEKAGASEPLAKLLVDVHAKDTEYAIQPQLGFYKVPDFGTTTVANKCLICDEILYASETGPELNLLKLRNGGELTSAHCTVTCTEGNGLTSGVCSPCNDGYYSDRFTRVVFDNCQICPAGRYSLRDNGPTTECTDCDAGTYSAGRAAECTNCDAGKYSGKESDPTRNKRGSLLRPA